MGWNSANEIFDPVAKAIISNRIDEKAALDILTVLIRNLQAEDWDTEDESLEDFKHSWVVVEAFRLCGIPDRDSYDEYWEPAKDNKLNVLVERLDVHLPIPTYAKPGDAGLDLYAAEDFKLRPLERRLVPTGLAVAIPEGYVGLVHPRSGLAHVSGVSIVNAPGVIDSGYRGEIKVNLINLDPNISATFKRRDRIAQLLVQRYEEVTLEDTIKLPSSERGIEGHGSTGLTALR